MMNCEEHQLVEKARGGDGRAFDALFTLHRKYLFNLLVQFSGDPALADDLSQEALLQAYHKLGTFRGQASFRTWLTRIAINLFLECRRRNSPHISLSLEGIQVSAGGEQPERKVIRQELQWCILHNLKFHLPENYRLVLVLRDLQNLSYKEIAGVLGWTLARTKTNLHRARQMFRAQFVDGKCKAFADDYLCICEGILDL